MKRKTIIAVVLLLFVFGCRDEHHVDGLKTDFEFHREKFRNYSDSFRKYVFIHNDCAKELSDYYYKMEGKEYYLAYPNGNPYDKKEIYDTICYPIKK